MTRTTGTYRTREVGGEKVRAFVPHPLPPKRPVLRVEGELAERHAEAASAVSRLEVAGAMVPSPDWFLYGFVRKEAVVSSQIEGTQATFEDVVAYEATQQSRRLADVEEVCNYVDALAHARAELAKPKGLPLCTRLLCAVHRRLMKGVRGSDKQPGTIRTSQNWIGGTRPGNARFVPPPPEAVPDALAALERWIHSDDPLPPLIKAGLAHVQFETIHPFLDGNGRIGRLLIALLVEHWGLLSSPLLYVSLGFKRHRQEYYRRLDAVRVDGDWEAWLDFFLDGVATIADEAVATSRDLFTLVTADRQRVIHQTGVNLLAVQLFERLPGRPIVTAPWVVEALSTTKPTAGRAIAALEAAGVLAETTGKKRDRVYAYRAYLDRLRAGTGLGDE